ncbi:MAG TPA: MATE family efflux transporter [Chitinophagaceae bacterium]|nr:MATE family efflux transporter [Chitinophagaceae bacterium]
MTSPVSSNDLQLETSTRQILGIALPISLAMLIPQLNFITNNIFIGRIGETELATAGITGVFYLIFALVGNGLNSGLQGLLSRRAGENRPLEIGKLFSQGLWIALFFALAAVLVTWLFSPYFLSFSLHDPEVQRAAVSFLKIRVWGVFFLYGFQICNAFLVSTNNSRYMKYGFWIQAGLNILLDWLLIFGHYGFPKLGFNGAAWASVISEFAGMLVVLGIVFYKKFYVRFELFKHWRYHGPLAGLIFRQSSPLVAQWLISIIAWLVFYIFIEHLGVRPLAISNIMRTIFGLFGIFVWAFASTTNTMVSNIIGQDKKDQVVRLIKKIMMLSLAFTFILCILINVFPALFIGFFTKDSSFIDEAIPVIRMVTIGIMAMSPATVWLNSVTGTGNTKVNLAIEIVAIILYTIYIYLIIELWKLSLVWAFSSELLYWSILFILSFLYIRSGKWKKKVI